MKKNLEFPIGAQAFNAVTRQRLLAEQLFNELLEMSRDIANLSPRLYFNDLAGADTKNRSVLSQYFIVE